MDNPMAGVDDMGVRRRVWLRAGRERRRGWLGWSALVAVAALGVASAALSVVNASDRIENIGLAIGHFALATVGVFILARRAAPLVGWLLVTIGVAGSFSLTAWQVAHLAAVRGDDLSTGRTAVAIADASFASVLTAAMLLGLTLPTGRLLSPRWRIIAGGVVAFGIAGIVVSLASPPHVDEIAQHMTAGEFPGRGSAKQALEVAFVVLLALSAVALLLRLRRAQGEERQQMRWVVFTGVIVMLHFPVSGSIESEVVSQLLPGLVTVLLAAGLTVALLRYRLWDIDVVLRRSVVYGVLWGSITLAYLAMASGFGLTAGSRLPVGLAIVSTAVAAMVFQPARRALERAADTWVFGERSPAHEAMGQLGARLQHADRVDDIATHLAHAATAALGLGRIEVAIAGRITAREGRANGEPFTVVPLARGEERIGELRCQARPGGSLTEDDEALLAALAGQAALAISHARLASRVVHAQAAEHRRIERDIHDGVQQELVALIAQLGLAGATSNGEGAVFGRLRADAQRILANLRDVAQGIHPSVLADGGLFEAVNDAAARLPLTVAIEVPTELRGNRFSDDVELAAYFFVAEALTNVVKHAGTANARVRFAGRDGTLHVEVSDTGRGFDPNVTPRRGLAGLADRIQAMGGRLVLESEPGTGTRVTATLPLTVGAHT